MGWQMIKITINSAVYEALQKAFPKPANSAHRALAKYISVLETMLFKSLHFEATPVQRKLDLFAISLQQLANQGGQIGPKKQRLHAWLRENNLSLIEPVIIGSNLTGDVSQCKLTKLVTMVDTLAVEDKILRSGKSEREIDQYLCGDEFGNYQVLNLLYPEFKQRINAGSVEELFDFVPVDKESIKSYIFWLTTESQHITRERKDQALRQARIILAVSSVMDGTTYSAKSLAPLDACITKARACKTSTKNCVEQFLVIAGNTTSVAALSLGRWVGLSNLLIAKGRARICEKSSVLP